jgi:hypothetical protein
MATAPAAADRDDTPYGFSRPDLAEAREAVRALFGSQADERWTTLIAGAGLSGSERDAEALDRLVGVMLAADPITALCGRALAIRATTYRHLAEANAIVRAAG